MDPRVIANYVFIYTTPVMLLLNALQLLAFVKYVKKEKRNKFVIIPILFLLAATALLFVVFKYGENLFYNFSRQFMVINMLVFVFSHVVSLLIRQLQNKVNIFYTVIQILVVIFFGCLAWAALLPIIIRHFA